MRFARFVLLALTAGLALTGCSTSVEGAPKDDGRPTGRLTAEELGDLRTINPCSLTGPFAFEEYGEAQLPAEPTMDACLITVTIDDEDAIIELGQLQHVDALPSGRQDVRQLTRGATVAEVPTQIRGACSMALLLADDTAMSATATAKLVDTVPQETLCTLAQAGAEGIFHAVGNNLVRHWEPAHNSLARVSACGLLPADKVATQLGITSDRVSLYPAEHQCRWGRPGGDTATLKLDFPVGHSPNVAGVSDRTRGEPVAGRPTWVVANSTSELLVCTVATEHIPFGLGRDLREYAVLRVSVPASSGKDACAIGRDLAATAWTQLPAGD
ncbi:hypothetical protein [Actinophytocola sp.]|uniref:hypothetical protein n=1 Tax=Actinophytocola sp. TaxID=1872138 RepID=UPI003D6B8B21